MTDKTRAAMQQALEALELAKASHGVMLMSNPPHDAWKYRGCDCKLAEAITALREALEQPYADKAAMFEHMKNMVRIDHVTGDVGIGTPSKHPISEEPKCNQHPDAPHGFDRNASHSAGRYVCECEGWEPEQPVSQEPVAWRYTTSRGIYRYCKHRPNTDMAAEYAILKPIPLYTAPQHVKEVELTDDDLNKLMDYWSEDERSAYGGAWRADGEYIDMKAFARSAIAAHKEKQRD